MHRLAKGIAMRQCSIAKKYGDRCGLHKTKAPHGTVAEPASAKVEESRTPPRQCSKRRQGIKWNCRHTLRHVAKKDYKKPVEALSDDEFEVCLGNVHKYFTFNPSYAVSWKFQEYQGPQSREDRFDATKFNYLGQPQKFKFFSRSAFDKVLLLIRTGATLESLSEDEFMSALDLTTKVCSNNAFVRNYVSPYAGTQ